MKVRNTYFNTLHDMTKESYERVRQINPGAYVISDIVKERAKSTISKETAAVINKTSQKAKSESKELNAVEADTTEQEQTSESA